MLVKVNSNKAKDIANPRDYLVFMGYKNPKKVSKNIYNVDSLGTKTKVISIVS